MKPVDPNDQTRPANPPADPPPKDEYGYPDNGKPFDLDKEKGANTGQQDVKHAETLPIQVIASTG